VHIFGSKKTWLSLFLLCSPLAPIAWGSESPESPIEKFSAQELLESGEELKQAFLMLMMMGGAKEISLAEEMLKGGFPADYRLDTPEDKSLLVMAIATHKANFVTLLLKYGAAISDEALTIAVSLSNDPVILSALLGGDLDPNQILPIPTDNTGFSPYDMPMRLWQIAFTCGCEVAIDLLMAKQIPFRMDGYMGLSSIRDFLAHHKMCMKEGKWTPYLVAAEEGPAFHLSEKLKNASQVLSRKFSEPEMMQVEKLASFSEAQLAVIEERAPGTKIEIELARMAIEKIKVGLALYSTGGGAIHERMLIKIQAAQHAISDQADATRRLFHQLHVSDV